MTVSTVKHPDHLAMPDRANLMERAKELEAAFLSEMLGHAGLGASSEHFNGGAGEDQFKSFLLAEQARQIVAKGGVGLAESIFQSLVGMEKAP